MRAKGTRAAITELLEKRRIPWLWRRRARGDSPQTLDALCQCFSSKNITVRLRAKKRPLAETIVAAIRQTRCSSASCFGLRLVRGLDKAAFRDRFGVDIEQAFPVALEQLGKRGYGSWRHTP
ncbi:MAG: hypothetical protein R2881_11380 [Eubacteriales bacterium]